MIVCLTGSHSTGKSTLLREFLRKPGYACVESVTRDTISSTERRIDDGVTEEGQLAILAAIEEKCKQLYRLDRKAGAEKTYILDRSVFDFMAYSYAFYQKGQISGSAWQMIREHCEEWLHLYDLIYYLPIEFGLVDDGERSVDEDLRQVVDRRIQDSILWYCPTKVVRLSGDVSTRVNQIESAISKIRING